MNFLNASECGEVEMSPLNTLTNSYKLAYKCKVVEGMVQSSIGSYLIQCFNRAYANSLDVIVLQDDGSRFMLQYQQFTDLITQSVIIDSLQAHFLYPPQDMLDLSNKTQDYCRIPVSTLRQGGGLCDAMRDAMRELLNYRLIVHLPNRQQLRVYVLNISELEELPGDVSSSKVSFLADLSFPVRYLDKLFSMIPAVSGSPVQCKSPTAPPKEQNVNQQQEIALLKQQLEQLQQALTSKEIALRSAAQDEDHAKSTSELETVEFTSMNAMLLQQNGQLVRENMKLLFENNELKEKMRIIEESAQWIADNQGNK